MNFTSRNLAPSLTLILVPLVMCFSACTGQQLTAVPAQLLGEWKTADLRYQGRSMNLAADHITFGMGGVAPDRLERVEAVRLVSASYAQEYKITLRTPDNSADTLILDFDQENGGMLRIKSQPEIHWTKMKASSPSVAPPHMPQSPRMPDASAILNEHKTIYKIDCIHRNVCKSY